MVNAGVFPKLIDLLRSSEFDIQKEAAWAVSNATSGGTLQRAYYYYPPLPIPLPSPLLPHLLLPLSSILPCDDANIIIMCPMPRPEVHLYYSSPVTIPYYSLKPLSPLPSVPSTTTLLSPYPPSNNIFASILSSILSYPILSVIY